MITSQYFNITSDASIFVSNRHIANKQHCAVWVKSLSNVWSQIPYNDYDLVNNSIILDNALLSTIYSQVELRVADSQEELGTPVTDISTTASIRDEVIVVADNIDNIVSVSDNISSLNDIADNMVKIPVVSDNINSIVNVANNISSIIDASSLSSKIITVADNISLINTVNTNSANINTVANNIGSVNDVKNNLTAILNVSDMEAKIDAVNLNINNVNSVGAYINNVNTVANKIPEVSTVAGSISNISTVAGASGNISTVAYNINNINNVATNITNINSVNSNASNINNVSSNIVNVANVGSNITKVNAVYDDISKGYRTNLTFLVYSYSSYTAIKFVLTNNVSVSININNTNPASWISTIQSDANYIANVKNTVLDIDSGTAKIALYDKSTTEFSNVSYVVLYNPSTSSWVNPSYWDTVSAIIRVSDNLPKIQDVANYMLSKQDLLVSGTNIKTLNGINLLGSGNIDLGSAGLGDMVKATYDTNNSGVVDNAEKVNGYTVDTNVPVDAVFTDTVYNDTELRGRVEAIEQTAYVIDTMYVHTDNNFTTILKNKLDGIADGAEANVNADWNALSGDAQILNKPNSIAGYGIIDVYSKQEIEAMIGDINSALDTINGEVI